MTFNFWTGLILVSAVLASPERTTNLFADDSEFESNDPQNIWKNREGKPEKASRVVGGSDAKKARYPYFVSLLTEGASDAIAPVCGGTLIAPDLVLTAAHCSRSRLRTAHVGRSDRTDPSDEFQSFSITKQIPHPNYVEENLDFDAMILKLSGQSNNPLIALNRDPSIPSSMGGEELLVMGFGVTQEGGDLSISASDTLQVGTIEHVPNDICASAKSPGVEETYQGRIKDDMVCGWALGVDACSGDSGAPLIKEGQNYMGDIQIGIVSFGYRCAHPDFPGVYSRVSFLWEWIKGTVCEYSNQPPAAFKCSNALEAIATDSSSLVGTSSGESPILALPKPTLIGRLVPVTLKIMFDSYASETGWQLKDWNGNLIASVPSGYYEDGRFRAIRTFFLQEGKKYSFKIEDDYRDGLCCSSPGNYLLIKGGSDAISKSQVLVFGKGDFGASATHEFEVSVADNEDNNAILASEVSESLQTEAGLLKLRLVLHLDDEPLETSWSLKRIGLRTEIVAEMPGGAYKWSAGQIVDFSIALEENELYKFTILDSGGNGLKEGRVKLYLGDGGEEGGRIIMDQDGSFSSSFETSFLASLTLPPPSAANTQSEDSDFMTLEIRMDLYPEEISFQLRRDTVINPGAVTIAKRSSAVIFFRPPRFYNISYTNQVVREKMPIPTSNLGSLQSFALIMIDAFGDGLCCKWQGRSSNTGYTLYKGDPSRGEVLVSSSFSSTSRESFSFTINGASLSNESPAIDGVPLSLQPVGEVPLLVILRLGKNPTGVGYAISDAEGRTLVDVPSGTMRERNSTIQQEYSMHPGVYTFTIFDSNGDGITIEDVAYELLRADMPGNPPILIGDGSFTEHREHTFVVEGVHATVPLKIYTKSDEEKLPDLGIHLERLDLIEADATVAMWYGGSQREAFHVQSGGLYRLSLLDKDQWNSTGTVIIETGTQQYQMEMNIDQKSRFVAGSVGGTPKRDLGDDFLTLSFPRELNSYKLEWILLAVGVEHSGGEGKTYTEREVIAFGPNDTSSNESFRNEIERIRLPPFVGKQSFMLIVTHEKGECCDDAVGSGLIQLYKGSLQDDIVVVGTSFQGQSRLIEMFSLAGTDNSEELTREAQPSFLGTGVVCAGMSLVFGYIVYRSCADKMF